MTMQNGWVHLTKPAPGLDSVSVRFEGYDEMPDGAWIFVDEMTREVYLMGEGAVELAKVQLPEVAR